MARLFYKKIGAIVTANEQEFGYFRSSFVLRNLCKHQYLLQEGGVCKYQAVEKGFRSYTETVYELFMLPLPRTKVTGRNWRKC